VRLRRLSFLLCSDVLVADALLSWNGFPRK
jgi:hypothetical protein